MKRKKVLFITLGAILVIIGLAVALFLNQISPERAQTLCNNFTQEVKANVEAVAGYSIAAQVSYCNPQGDEAGGTDYVPSVTLRVVKGDIETVEKMKSSLNYLAQSMPKTNYAVFIDNVAAIANEPAAICVNAYKYIDNDGKDYPQGDGGNHPRYTEPGSIDGFMPCEGLH